MTFKKTKNNQEKMLISFQDISAKDFFFTAICFRKKKLLNCVSGNISIFFKCLHNSPKGTKNHQERIFGSFRES